MDRKTLEKIKPLLAYGDIKAISNEGYTLTKTGIEKLVNEYVKVSQVEKRVSPMLAEEIEKQMLENQYAKVKVLSCKGDPYGEHLPTKILLQLGKETKWFIKTDE